MAFLIGKIIFVARDEYFDIYFCQDQTRVRADLLPCQQVCFGFDNLSVEVGVYWVGRVLNLSTFFLTLH